MAPKNEKRIELYTAKFDVTARLKTAKLCATVTATVGTVEDVNEAMNKFAVIIREAFPDDTEVEVSIAY